MGDLFSYSTTRETRREAHEAMAPSIPRLQHVAMRTLDRLGTATAVEVVEASGIASDAIRLRVSELLGLGLAETNGQRRRNPSGKTAAVVQLTDAGRAALREYPHNDPGIG